MKVYPFYEGTNAHTLLHLHGDSIHMYIHCSSPYLEQTHDVYNIDISLAPRHLGALFAHTPYLMPDDYVPFPTFLSSLLHQYNYNTRHTTSPSDITQALPYQHTTMALYRHHSITSLVIDWTRLLLMYTHGLVSSLPPANYSRETMNVINHIYIGILPRSIHATIR